MQQTRSHDGLLTVGVWDDSVGEVRTVGRLDLRAAMPKGADTMIGEPLVWFDDSHYLHVAVTSESPFGGSTLIQVEVPVGEVGVGLPETLVPYSVERITRLDPQDSLLQPYDPEAPAVKGHPIAARYGVPLPGGDLMILPAAEDLGVSLVDGEGGVDMVTPGEVHSSGTAIHTWDVYSVAVTSPFFPEAVAR